MRQPLSEPKSLRFLWGGIAVVVYFVIIGLLLLYFNHRSTVNPKHFVVKDEKRVQVMEAEPIKAIKVKTIVEKSKPIEKPKKVIPKKTKVVKPIKPKIIPKKEKVILKEKIVKKKVIKKKDENRTKPKKKKSFKVNKPMVKVKKEVNKKNKPKKVQKPKKPSIKKTSDLFSSVKVTQKEAKVVKNKIQVTNKPQRASKNIANNKQSDSGIENAYFAKVQSLLETWPAQSNYAGEKAMVTLHVNPTGLFEFKVKSQSDNVDFNLGLIDFLMQLQRTGLGKHDAGKTYEIEVEFTAKE